MEMEFEEQEEQEEEMGLQQGGNYESSRIKMTTTTTSPPGNNNNNEATTQTLPGQQHLRKPRYRECQKNHAVGIGGHAVDGCGEFMAAGSEGTLESLKCAACNCHRNFHRKETSSDTAFIANSGRVVGSELYFSNPHQVQQQFTPYYRTPAGYLHVAATQQRPLALPSTSGGTHSREDQEDVSNPGFMGSSTRKRFRTKFTQEQKDKMLGLAEKLGWRIQKHDEVVVQQFCNETGVKRHVLKVWMHNNKHTLGKKP